MSVVLGGGIFGTTLTSGTWVFVAFTIDDKTIKCYQNASLNRTDTYPATLLTDGSKGNLQIGAYKDAFSFVITDK